jgi:hypothetical protein
VTASAAESLVSTGFHPTAPCGDIFARHGYHGGPQDKDPRRPGPTRSRSRRRVVVVRQPFARESMRQARTQLAQFNRRRRRARSPERGRLHRRCRAGGLHGCVRAEGAHPPCRGSSQSALGALSGPDRPPSRGLKATPSIPKRHTAFSRLCAGWARPPELRGSLGPVIAAVRTPSTTRCGCARWLRCY